MRPDELIDPAVSRGLITVPDGTSALDVCGLFVHRVLAVDWGYYEGRQFGWMTTFLPNATAEEVAQRLRVIYDGTFSPPRNLKVRLAYGHGPRAGTCLVGLDFLLEHPA